MIAATQTFIEHAFDWAERLFEAAPAGITTLQVPLVPALMAGLGFEKFTRL